MSDSPASDTSRPDSSTSERPIAGGASAAAAKEAAAPLTKDRRARLSEAVHQSEAGTKAGFLERAFTWAFQGLVYPQIWEDPEIDMEALELGPGKRLITIASGGCNMMSYLVADPDEVLVVDLNTTHVALAKLKLAAAAHLPTYQLFFRFFGHAADRSNRGVYERLIAPHLDAETRAFWDGRDAMLRKRISLFERDLYSRGLLGAFIRAGHWLSRRFGVDPREAMDAGTMAEQRRFFEEKMAPLFEKRFIRWLTSNKMSLFGLGIPPAQYDALATAGNGDVAVVLKRRLEKLLCDFPLSENYFAWQAFGRGYAPGDAGPLPPYLQSRHFETLKARADRVSVRHLSYTERLAEEPDGSLHAYLMLDAQDWMNDDQLNALWAEITRTAAPGARVLFRTAALPSLLPGRVREDVLSRWRYEAEASEDYTRRDRSAIYGANHLYVFEG